MTTIYSVQVSNAHQSIIAENEQQWFEVAGKINKVEFGKASHQYRFQFYAEGKKPLLEPNAGCIYMSGAFAFAKSLKSALFPGSSPGYEFLEIQVGQSDWLLLNCLSLVSDVGPRSQVMRGIEGDIFLVTSLFVPIASAPSTELFVLRDSNRSQLFAQKSFKERALKAGVQGVQFAPVGEFTT